MTFREAKHTAVLSLAALRKLHFPIEGNADASAEARLVLTSLGLFALTELRRDGYDLRSRCALVLACSPTMEIVRRDGTTDPFSLDDTGAKLLVDAALHEAEIKSLAWRQHPVELKPSTALADLIIRSRGLGTLEADGGEEEVEEENQDAAPEG